MEPSWSYELVPTEAEVDPPDLVVSCFDVADLNGVMTSDIAKLYHWISQTGTAPSRDSEWCQRIESGQENGRSAGFLWHGRRGILGDFRTQSQNAYLRGAVGLSSVLAHEVLVHQALAYQEGDPVTHLVDRVLAADVVAAVELVHIAV